MQLSKHAANVLQIPEDVEFEVLYSLQIQKYKTPSLHVTPPDAKPALVAGLLET